MKKSKCLIIDDEPIAIRILERHLEAFPEVEVLETFTSAPKALIFLRSHQVDIIFSDIEMPLMNGIEFLKSFRHQPAIVFTTAYRNFAVEAYDLDVIDYLLKPISIERLGRAIDRYYERMGNVKSNENESDNGIINFKVSTGIIRMPISNIRYIESFGDYVIIHHKDGRLTSRERLSHMETKLDKRGFIRIHRQFIVANQFVTAINGNMLQVGDNQLPVGRTYRSTVQRLLQSPLENRLSEI
ncbi:LytR/AlgR family response regulator transcription factor [Carboxylicivirga marina]|uniref:Response regulator transcription factor n=1 Tax=Carboxylicivirga marina TaxID=2800988 RepID=A0ABS1HEA5_9BACT|nr:LytTR family DNA-binding domain-containing protein [Carboxylicivirga marina]MBK3516002.1 response regulator transcription factor [Carboxylicivirga marina]